jgi:hypothetical protein
MLKVLDESLSGGLARAHIDSSDVMIMMFKGISILKRLKRASNETNE